MYQAVIVGIISGSAIIIGALMGLYIKVGNKVLATVMAFGAGVLISALSIDLMSDAFEQSRSPLIIGLSFLAGAVVFVAGDYFIDNSGGLFRRQSHGAAAKVKGQEPGGNPGLPILLGTLLDGIPESFVVGASVAAGGSAGIVFVAAVFLSNLPEGISGTLGMKMAGMSPRRIIWLWLMTFAVTILASMAGYAFLSDAPAAFHSAIMAFASGAILAMLSDTMIPEAFRFGGRLTALVTVAGFLLAFLLSRMF